MYESSVSLKNSPAPQQLHSAPECAAQVPRRVGEIEQSLSRQSCGIDQLQAAVDELHKRLSPVLARRPACGQKEENPANSCELANVIDGNTLRISAVNQRVNEIVELLEL